MIVHSFGNFLKVLQQVIIDRALLRYWIQCTAFKRSNKITKTKIEQKEKIENKYINALKISFSMKTIRAFSKKNKNIFALSIKQVSLLRYVE